MSEHNGHHGEAVIDDLLSLPIPRGWTRTNIGAVGEVRLGRQRSPKNRSADYPVKYLRAANITWNGLDLTDVLDMEFRPTEMAAYRLEPGDVLLSEASGSPTEVGKPAIWKGELEDCCFQNTVIRFRSKTVDAKFALIVFQHFARNAIFSRVSRGVGIHHLSADRFSSMPFLLPPWNEQRRIVGKIEELFSDLEAGVAALTRARANLKRYRASVLKAAVEGVLTAEWRTQHPQVEPASKLLERLLTERRRQWEADQLAKFAAAGKQPPNNWQAKYIEPTPPDTTNLPTLPDGWRWVSVEQLVARSEYGTSVKCDYEAKGVAVLRIPNIAAGRIDLSNLKFATQPVELGESDALVGGDMLMCRTNGSISLIGKTAVVPLGFKERTSFASYLLRFRFVEPATLPEWVHAYVSSLLGRRFIERNAASSAGQHNISLSLISRMPIPLPPLAEQSAALAEVSEKLSQIESAEVAIEHSLRRAARLRQSILKQAFEGKLVPQDPTDEPATSLLERLRTSAAETSTMRTEPTTTASTKKPRTPRRSKPQSETP